MRSFVRVLRVLSAVTLFFFCWTFLPLYAAVAYATEKKPQPVGKQQAAAKSQGSSSISERFEKALEDIREKIEKAEDKHGRF